MMGIKIDAQIRKVGFTPSGYPCGGLKRILRGLGLPAPDFDMGQFKSGCALYGLLGREIKVKK
jgi:hypothetical protein